MIRWQSARVCAEVNRSLAVTPVSPYLDTTLPLTPYLHPIKHDELLATLQARDITVKVNSIRGIGMGT